MADRLDQLEYTVMELGAEVFRLRQEVNELSSRNEDFTKAFQQIKEILSEKGIINSDDIDLSTNLQTILNQLIESPDLELEEPHTELKSILH